jgi:tetratricopeptide (TPR) repeat protein
MDVYQKLKKYCQPGAEIEITLGDRTHVRGVLEEFEPDGCALREVGGSIVFVPRNEVLLFRVVSTGAVVASRTAGGFDVARPTGEASPRATASDSGSAQVVTTSPALAGTRSAVEEPAPHSDSPSNLCPSPELKVRVAVVVQTVQALSKATRRNPDWAKGIGWDELAKRTTEQSDSDYSRILKEIERVKNIAQYAHKIGELSRIDDAFSKHIRPLAEQHPQEPNIHAFAARICMIRGRQSEAFSFARDAARRSRSPSHWILAAVNAPDERRELVSLTRSFHDSELQDEQHVRERLMRLVCLAERHNEWSLLPEAIKPICTREDRTIATLAREALGYCANQLGDHQLALEVLNEMNSPDQSEVLGWLSRLEVHARAFCGAGMTELLKEFEAVAPPPVSPQRPAMHSGEPADRDLVGTVKAYGAMQFGFIVSAQTGKTYYFRHGDVEDLTVRAALAEGLWKGMSVQFDERPSPDQPYSRAVRIWQSLESNDADQSASRVTRDGDPKGASDRAIRSAHAWVRRREFARAFEVLNRHLEVAPGDEAAKKLRADLRRKHRELGIGLPSGSGAYQSAKRAQLVDGNSERAIECYQDAIKTQPGFRESAIKDLAHLFAQEQRIEEALSLLRDAALPFLPKASPYDNSLATLCEHARRSEEAVQVLDRLLRNTPKHRVSEQLRLLKRLSYSYTHARKFIEARRALQQARSLAPQDDSIEAYLAQLDRLENATGGEMAGAFSEGVMLQSREEMEFTPLARHFMKECEYRGFPQEVIESQCFEPRDLNRVKQLAERSKADREASDYWIAVAAAQRHWVCKIVGGDSSSDTAPALINESRDEFDAGEVRRALHNFFTRRAKLAMQNGSHIDSIATLHLETAIVASSKDRERSVIHFLSADAIQQSKSVGDLKTFFEGVTEPQAEFVASRISWAVSASPSIAKLIYTGLRDCKPFDKKLRSLLNIQSAATQDEAWDAFLRASKERAEWADRFGAGVVNLPVLDTALSELIGQLDVLRPGIDLDQRYLERLRSVCRDWQSFCGADSFTSTTVKFQTASEQTGDLRTAILDTPTAVALTRIVPLLKRILELGETRWAAQTARLRPNLQLELDVRDAVLSDAGEVSLPFSITNQRGCAEATDLRVKLMFKDRDSEPIVELHFVPKLDGGEALSRRFKVRVPESLRAERAIAIEAAVRFVDLTGEERVGGGMPYSLQLMERGEFSEIANRYAQISGGNPVADPKLFAGRAGLLDELENKLFAGAPGKCLVLHGQKRAGKSSILFHLQNRLANRLDCACIKFSILELEHGVSERALAEHIIGELKGLPGCCDAEFPSREEVASAPFGSLRRSLQICRRRLTESACSRRVVFLIDEFTEVYKQIIAGELDARFMKSWKALVEQQHFSAVLVGQDIIHAFKAAFPNEFGVTEDKRVSYLDEAGARELMCNNLPANFMQDSAIAELRKLTAWSPYYLAIALYELVELANEGALVAATSADVQQVQARLVTGDRRLGSDKFDCLLLAGDSREDSGFSSDESLEFCSRLARERILRIDSLGESDRRLVKNLEDRDVVERLQGAAQPSIRLRVGLFESWLRERIK